MLCNSCPRRCNTDRKLNIGTCGAPDEFKIARAALHFWEEPCISGKGGSGTVFFSGCNLGCVYCQNSEISRSLFGEIISDERLAEIFNELIDQGAENINLVTPTHYSMRLAKFLGQQKPSVPVVFNCGGYDKLEVLRMLDGLVDVYLTDLKYITPERAEKYSAAADYFEVCSKAIAEMKRQQPEDIFNEEGVMQKGVIIRHLVLPKNTNQSIKILDYIAENYGTETYMSLMSQYTPCGNIDSFPELQRKVTKHEYEKVVDHAVSLGFKNIFTQETTSSGSEYIPPFDLEGVKPKGKQND